MYKIINGLESTVLILDNVINDDAYFMVGEDSFSQISNQITINIVWQCEHVHNAPNPELFYVWFMCSLILNPSEKLI